MYKLNVADLFSRADRITKVKRLPVHAVWKPERPALRERKGYFVVIVVVDVVGDVTIPI